MKRQLLLALLCLQALFMSADVLKCRVTDADTGEPLEGAKVRIFQQLMNSHAYWVDQNTDSCGVCLWTVSSMSKVTIDVNYFGYEPLKKQFNCAGGSKDTPTMRSETQNETFHRYLSLTFTYNFDAKAKKK